MRVPEENACAQTAGPDVAALLDGYTPAETVELLEMLWTMALSSPDQTGLTPLDRARHYCHFRQLREMFNPQIQAS